MAYLDFSSYVRQRANQLGINLTEVAKRTGMTRQGLYKLMDSGAEQCRISSFVKLANALQVHPLVLMRIMFEQSELPKFTLENSKHELDASGFIRDVTIPDNSIVFTNQRFTKTWEGCGLNIM